MSKSQLIIIARIIIRSGEISLNKYAEISDGLTLPDIEGIEALCLFPIILERRNDGWYIRCPQIQEELHSYFYFGQSAGDTRNSHGESTISNPTQWIAEWRNRRSA